MIIQHHTLLLSKAFLYPQSSGIMQLTNLWQLTLLSMAVPLAVAHPGDHHQHNSVAET
jgi:hypothetical protein